eukprot:gene7249-7462_t
MSCERDAVEQIPSWGVPLIAGLSVLGVLLLAAAALMVWFRMAVQLKNKWQRNKELDKHRQLGVPKQGLVSIVVTDVESYSDLTRLEGGVTAQALGMHNAILRSAAAAHAGHVIEQEGDSWSVAFYSPMEALGFCLQVQQALQECSWPSELRRLLRSKAPAAAQDDSSHGHGTHARPSSSDANSRPLSVAQATPASAPTAKSTHAQQAVHGSAAVTSSDGVQQSGLSRLFKAHHGLSRPSLISGIGLQQRMASVFSAFLGGNATTTPTSCAAGSKLIKGLRVRMGVATGGLLPHTAITSSAVFELAKGVSEAANGGQVLLEAATFDAVRDRLTELAIVDHNGYNDKLMGTGSKVAIGASAPGPLRFVWRLLSYLFKSSTADGLPLLVDMGQYHVSGLNAALQASSGDCCSTPNTAGGPAQADKRSSSSPGLPAHMIGSNAALAVAAMAVTCSAPSNRRSLHLYSMAASTLQDRCHYWRGKLQFKEAAQPLARGYYDAPGVATERACREQPSDIPAPLIAAVTTVFLAVEGGKLIVRRRPEVARVVESVLCKVMQALMLSLPEGYMCRRQEGALKYIVAFKEPMVAVKWSLMLQEVLQHVPWPAEVAAGLGSAAHRRTRATLSADGRPSAPYGAGSRPLLKIGLADGLPDSVLLDHLGHADYFGNSVNLAARMMDACARGGQIVASAELAESVFSAWRYEANMTMQQPKLDGEAETILVQEVPSSCQCISLTGGTHSKPAEQVPAAAAVDVVKHALPEHDATIADWSVATCSMAEESTAELPQLSGSKNLPLLVADVQLLAVDSQMAVSGSEQAPLAMPRQDATLDNQPPAGMNLPRSQHDDYEREVTCRTAKLKGTWLDNRSTAGNPGRLVHVTAHHLGTYGFKGCGALDMVCFTTDTLHGAIHPTLAMGAEGAKGTLIMASSGPVLGLQDCPLLLPDVLTALQQAWGDMASSTTPHSMA